VEGSLDRLEMTGKGDYYQPMAQDCTQRVPAMVVMMVAMI